MSHVSFKTQPAELPNVAVLTPYITRILGLNPGPFTLQGTNTYLVGDPTQCQRVLIDSGQGLPRYAHLLKTYLDLLNLKLSAIMITHWHMDHCDGVESVCETLGYTPPIMKIDSASTGMPADFWVKLEDMQVVDLAGVSLQILHTPGHCDDHACIWMTGEGIEEPVLFSGDNILGHGTTIFYNYIEYISSLRRVKAIKDLGKIYPGHGQLIYDGPSRVDEYIAHRVKREKEVAAILAREPEAQSSWAITKLIYGEKPPKVFEAANRGIEQYLKKLVLDGFAQVDDDGMYSTQIKHKI